MKVATRAFLMALIGASLHALAAPASAATLETHAIESRALGETYSYRVRLPDGYADGTEAYPLLIVLDGLIDTAAVIAEGLRIPRMILVDVESNHRDRDMNPAEPAEKGGVAGRADAFLAYITEEMLPRIDRQYRTRPYRMLIGYSRSGLFVIHALTQRPEVFQAYLAIDPSLHVADQGAVKALIHEIGQRPSLRADLFVTNSGEVRGTTMMGGALKLWAALEDDPPAGMRWWFRPYPTDDHGSVILPSVYDGLRAIFEGYAIDDPVRLFDLSGVAGFERHYGQWSQRMGYDIPVPYFDLLWDTTVRLEQIGRIAEAGPLLEKLVEMEGGKGGETFLWLAKSAAARKEDARAVELLEKSLRLFPGSVETRELLAARGIDADRIAPSLKLSAAERRRFAGTYDGVYRSRKQSLIVKEEGDGLVAQADGGGFGSCELRALTRTRLYCAGPDAEFTFHGPGTGAFVRVTAEFPSGGDHWPRNQDYTRVE